MKTIYIDCSMGIAGDMLMGALYELLEKEEQEIFLETINHAGIPGVKVNAVSSTKCGIVGTHMEVKVYGKEEEHSGGDEGHCHDHGHHDHHHSHGGHAHSDLGSISSILETLNLPGKARKKATDIYRKIAEAEAQVHGEKPEHVHFHEVGSLDAITDVAGCCLLMEMLGAEKIIFSPVNVGGGMVRCAHGILPVPAPATALLLRGIPSYGGDINSELCTPTGAALARAFSTGYGPMPEMVIEKTGYGMGTKDFERANCIRAISGEFAGGSIEGSPKNSSDQDDYGKAGEERIVELACNIDDMTGEEIGFAAEMLLKNGARDVYTEPIYMKKSRPAVKLVTAAAPEDAEKIAGLILRYTTTIGVRQYDCKRYVLARRFEKRKTPLGEITVKVSEGYGVKKEKPEYDQLAALAERKGISLTEAGEKVRRKTDEE